jgi:hypothetical protein
MSKAKTKKHSTSTPERARVPSPFDLSFYLSRDASLPKSNTQLNEIGARLDKKLCEIVTENLGPRAKTLSPQKWNEYIFDAVKDFGATALLSHGVVRQIFDWQTAEGGVVNLRRLGVELAKAAETRQGIGKGRITIRNLWAKPVFVAEVGRLKRRLFDSWPETHPELLEFINREVSTEGGYPFLLERKAALMDFLKKRRRLAMGLRESPQRGSASDDKTEWKNVTPTSFFYELLAYSECRAPESIRQEFSTLKRRYR